MVLRFCTIVFLIVIPGTDLSCQTLEEIVYTSWGQLCSVSSDGSRSFCRPQVNDNIRSPVWSPDGVELIVEVCFWDEWGHCGPDYAPYSLWVMDDSGKLLRQLDRSEKHYRAVWSLDGQNIFATNQEFERSDSIVRWNRDGGSRAVISMAPKANDTLPLWPPGLTLGRRFGADSRLHGFGWLNADQVVYIANDQQRLLRVRVLTVSTQISHDVLPASGGLRRGDVVVGPDRNSIVFMASGHLDGGSGWPLWRYAFADQKLVRLTESREAILGSWRW